MASNRNNRASGIGLAISPCLVELQGGRIEVESELGKESTFRFSLAVAQSNFPAKYNYDRATNEIFPSYN